MLLVESNERSTPKSLTSLLFYIAFFLLYNAHQAYVMLFLPATVSKWIDAIYFVFIYNMFSFYYYYFIIPLIYMIDYRNSRFKFHWMCWHQWCSSKIIIFIFYLFCFHNIFDYKLIWFSICFVPKIPSPLIFFNVC